jgi:hypothetical protein
VKPKENRGFGEQRLRFQIPMESGNQTEGIDLLLYAFDAKGELLTQAPVQTENAELKLRTDQVRGLQLFVGPRLPGRQPSIGTLQQIGAYEPAWRYPPNQVESSP